MADVLRAGGRDRRLVTAGIAIAAVVVAALRFLG